VGGLLWTLVTPLANMLIYIFLFSVVLKIRLEPAEVGTDNFAIYLLSGLLPWLAFAESLNSAAGIFLNRSDLITKVAFPLEVLPISSVVVAFLINGIGILIFLAYLTFQGYASVYWCLLPIIFFLHMVFTVGVTVAIATMIVFMRDIEHAVSILVAIWFYLTPILYPVSMIPDSFLWVTKINPMYPMISLYHDLTLFHKFDPFTFGISFVVAVLTLFVGIYIFRRCKNAFADVL
jgi:lipopolysaccharide transport system permease protein